MKTRVMPKHVRFGQMLKQQYIIEGLRPGESKYKQVCFEDKILYQTREEADEAKKRLDGEISGGPKIRKDVDSVLRLLAEALPSEEDRKVLANYFQKVMAAVKKKIPTVVCLCGSTRFKAEYMAANEAETLKGNVVLAPGCFSRATPEEAARGEFIGCTPEQKVALDDLHKVKIDLADEVLVLNVGGYVGDSTRDEIDYALRCGKKLRFLEPLK